MKWFDRTWLVIVILLVGAAILFQPGWLLSILSMIQSLVIIVLGSVATVYLWKRL